ncbi:arabinan endo-1,5-alpha-L-arabinosidase [Hymenobacter sp. BT770]|uniref:arabinan endo-1,5-alpha-L-arabinosidase n=1 Tax=Hymenobacter sp. BT770 TaxID=2886942 RepID=UPI001D110F33|nr:arabinan endo-1,5-alpha-L-arabinosidase [Hymenobacter sp. BT770]MCC3154400.1 arabinan endo-1,5-alpha-L-arabinosidase [Hymenobacter sp. BT770]MDO3416271.1 arabinan endo-1,5-alpha-L-arabinosidase [Hymenobacter sp. BT770]
MPKLLLLALLLTCLGATAQTAPATTGAIPAHDPVMIRQEGTYYLFCTGMGIAVWSSADRKTWKAEKPVFAAPPTWAVAAVPGFKGHVWAPDISFANGQYSLFYSVSAFGKNTSCIGLVTNKTLNPASPDFKWVDHGRVIQSVPGRDMWNAIDPNLARDAAGAPWLTFGSFWDGIKLVKLRPDLTAPAQPEQWRTIAHRPRDPKLNDSLPGDGAIEGPFIFKKGGFYYLFTSFDYCCRGPQSTYKMMVGRAASITGPYVDRAGLALDQGGGTVVLAGDSKWYGVGHNAVCTFDNVDYLVFHGYDASDRGRPKLRIEKLSWDKDGWPAVAVGQ